jgi:hypothetical protein
VSRPQRTLADIYADKPLTDAQCRRIVALLGLTQPRRKTSDAEVAASTPPSKNTQQRAS